MKALVILVLGVVATGCLKNAAYPCSQQSDCLRSNEQGVCETTGFCSFADSSCPDGRRYGDLSGSLANTCVGEGPPVDGPPIDDPVTSDTPIDDPTTAPFCDAAGEPDLVGCWEFENNLTDASGDNNNGTVGGNVTFVTGKVGKAMQQDGTGHVTVVDSASLQPGSITIEAWIMPTQTSAARMGVVDNQNSYGMFITPNLAGLQCTNVTVASPIPLNVFTHVACTYEANVGSHLYINGVDVAQGPAAAALGAGTTDGLVIGGDSPGPADALVGRIDQLRIWKVARSAAQICAATGQTTCP